MACLGAKAYDPAVAVTKSTASLLAMTAFDTTNLRITFTVGPSGKVLVRIQCTVHGSTSLPAILLGVMEGATVVKRVAPMRPGASPATALVTHETIFVVEGLTEGAVKTWDAAYSVETVIASTAIKYGGPNDATANNAFGAIILEVWDA